MIIPCSLTCLRVWSRKTGSAVPSRVSLLISILKFNLVLTHGIPPDFRGGVHSFISNRHTPSGQSRVYRVKQLRTDGVHCRESAGTGPVVLKVVPVTGAAILQVAMDQLMCASLIPHPHYCYEVDILIEGRVSGRLFHFPRYKEAGEISHGLESPTPRPLFVHAVMQISLDPWQGSENNRLRRCRPSVDWSHRL